MKEQIEKQAIEEMAKVIEKTEQIARDAHCGYPSPRMYATDLYRHGYCKQSEVERLQAQIEHLTAENKRLQNLLNDLMKDEV